MALSTTQITNLRNKFGFTESTLDDDRIAELYEQATTEYPNKDENVYFAVLCVYISEELRNGAANLVTHATGNSREQLSDIWKHWKDAHADYKDDLQEALNRFARNTLTGGVFMQLRQRPARDEDRPNE